ncbi:MAG: hypothetical protein E5V28_03785 [Mesorhizobium sp.]|nr:MAG: hypothetical protein E5V28_03785 [Mesorhizobium sp.]
MSNRYATIIIDDDGCEVVSAIGQFEGVPDARGSAWSGAVPSMRSAALALPWEHMVSTPVRSVWSAPG